MGSRRTEIDGEERGEEQSTRQDDDDDDDHDDDDDRTGTTVSGDVMIDTIGMIDL